VYIELATSIFASDLFEALGNQASDSDLIEFIFDILSNLTESDLIDVFNQLQDEYSQYFYSPEQNDTSPAM